MKKDIFFVIIQFLLFAIYFIDWNLNTFDVNTWIRYTSMVLIVLSIIIILFGILNLNKNIWPFPTPKKGSFLVTGGIYKYIRHPIYSGILIGFFFYGIYTGSVFKVIVSILLYMVFHFKSSYEEEQLSKMFESYSEYKNSTGRFFPKFFNKS